MFLFPPQLLLSGLVTGAIIGLVSIGIGLIWGVADVINFAYADYMMTAMYVTWFLNAVFGINPILVLPIIFPLYFCVGGATYVAIFRKVASSSPMIHLLCTFGLLLVIRYGTLAALSGDIRFIRTAIFSQFINIGGLVISQGELAIVMACIAVSLLIFAFLKYTRVGKAIRATAQDKEAAMAIGIDFDRICLITWGLSTAFAGVAACLITTSFGFTPLSGELFFMPAVTAVMLSGLGRVHTNFVAGLAIGLIQVISGYFGISMLSPLYVYGIFLAVLFLRSAREPRT